MSDADVIAAIGDIGVVPVVEITRSDTALPLAAVLLEAELPCVEITLRTAESLAALAVIRERYPDLLLGAGTVLSVTAVERVADLGVDFVVSPGTDQDVIERCRSLEIATIPGACTPSEIQFARKLGAAVVKIFPAEVIGGVGFVNAVAPACPGTTFMPTGGITQKNLGRYLAHPAVVACGGSWIASRSLLEAGDFGQIGRLASGAVNTVRATRTSDHTESDGHPDD